MPELRKDPLTGRWVIISTERSKRPDQFAPLEAAAAQVPTSCPFCEGHEEATAPEIFALRPKGSAPNTPGWQVRVIPSLNPVLRIEGSLERRPHGIYDWVSGIGAHEIIVETPQHKAEFSELSHEAMEQALTTAKERMVDLERDPRFRYILFFKNSGPAAGEGKYRHSRSQLIALPVNPSRLKDELDGCLRYFETKERCIFCDLVRQESSSRERLVDENGGFVAITPFASRFPFELWILPTRHCADFVQLDSTGTRELAQLLKKVLGKLSGLLKDPSYNMILHTAPLRRARAGYWRTIDQDFHWHLEIVPRLTRVAGFEWGSGFYINPTPPEEAARFLKGP